MLIEITYIKNRELIKWLGNMNFIEDVDINETNKTITIYKKDNTKVLHDVLYCAIIKDQHTIKKYNLSHTKGQEV